MKVKQLEQCNDFKPFDITVTIESEEDAKKFHAIFNNPRNTKYIGTEIGIDIINVIEEGLGVESVEDFKYYE